LKFGKLLAIVLLWVPAAVIALTWNLWKALLPSELPTHWSNSGPADAASSAPEVFGWSVGIAAGVALVATVLMFVPLAGAWTQRATAGIGAAVAAFVLGIWLGSSASSINVTDPYTVELGAWLLFAFVLPLYGLLPLWLLPKGDARPVRLSNADAVAPTRLAAAGGSWHHVVTSKLFIIVAAIMLIFTVFMVSTSIGSGDGAVNFSMILMVLATLMVAVLCAFRVSVDERGFRVTSMLFGIPIKRIRVATIDTVEVAVLEPMAWGGWGYRVTPGRSAIVLRTGPGLVITQRDQKQFAISLDAPEAPASLLLGLLGPAEDQAG
jgi:hypothetical protein